MKNSEDTGTYIIAEAGLNHNGSVSLAKKLIDVASIAGANAVKFQKRTVNKLAVKEILDTKDERFPAFGKTYREIREYLEFGFEQYVELKHYAMEKNIDFIVTAFDEEAVNFLEKVGVEKFKLASHSLTNLGLLDYLASKKKECILSTGMADIDDIDRAVDIFKSHKAPLSLMHCVSAYPTPLTECNIAFIDVLRERYGLNTGYSGHELGYLPTLTAVARGAKIIERHFTLDRGMIGFDHKISLEPDELIAMIRDIRSIKGILGGGDKTISESEQVTLNKYHVSMVSAFEIPAGTRLTDVQVTYKNPGTGIQPKNSHLIIGKRARYDIPEDAILTEDMFE